MIMGFKVLTLEFQTCIRLCGKPGTYFSNALFAGLSVTAYSETSGILNKTKFLPRSLLRSYFHQA